MIEPLFPNRIEAGKILAKKLHHYADRNEVLILAIPRGGVPVAFAVSQALNVPLDIVLVRKLGLPGREEFAMGAIASDGIELLNKDLIDTLRITPSAVDKIRAEQLQELKRREAAYRGDLNLAAP
jgi:putative phosphoribosyl transferase